MGNAEIPQGYRIVVWPWKSCQWESLAVALVKEMPDTQFIMERGPDS